MRDVRLVELAARQHNRLSRAQLQALGLSKMAIQHRLERGDLVIVEEGVYAFPPVMDDDAGRWMAATLTAPGSYLSHVSAAALDGFWDRPREFEIVTRPGSGGPRRLGGVLVCRSILLEGETTLRGPIAKTTPERTLIDVAGTVDRRALARTTREALRLGATTVPDMFDAIGRHRGRRGVARLALALERHAGLPIARARSASEVQAMIVLRDAGVELPRLNQHIAGEEADLSWAARRLIVEIDGEPFHRDVGEDARKQAAWESAGWTVRRLPSGDVWEHPHRLLSLAERA